MYDWKIKGCKSIKQQFNRLPAYRATTLVKDTGISIGTSIWNAWWHGDRPSFILGSSFAYTDMCWRVVPVTKLWWCFSKLNLYGRAVCIMEKMVLLVAGGECQRKKDLRLFGGSPPSQIRLNSIKQTDGATWLVGSSQSLILLRHLGTRDKRGYSCHSFSFHVTNRNHNSVLV